MQLKRLVLSPLILAKHGTLRPRSIRLADSSHLVYLNPDDDRAYKKLVMDSVRGRISTPMHFWRDHVHKLAPALCLDVGANYGECFAFGDYPQSQCIAVEANPTLQPYLAQTLKAHPHADRIQLDFCLIGDEEGGEASLYYSPKWTGGGSAIPGNPELTVVKVPRKTLDSIVAAFPDWHTSPLVIKMDIEGYEGHAIDGFSNLFQRQQVIGIMEFDTLMLSKAGTNPQVLFNRLAEHFIVFLTFAKQRRLLPIHSWDELMRYAKPHGLHCDLAFCSDQKLLAPTWSIDQRRVVA